jgi:hypothetical protein
MGGMKRSWLIIIARALLACLVVLRLRLDEPVAPSVSTRPEAIVRGASREVSLGLALILNHSGRPNLVLEDGRKRNATLLRSIPSTETNRPKVNIA